MIRIVNADVMEGLAGMPDESVQCCVTSPPYWGLRDYDEAGQLGLEKTPEEYVEKMVAVFREVRRVLRKDGTLWLNMGDCYAAQGRSGRDEGYNERTGRGEIVRHNRDRVVPPDLKPKDLVGMPWHLAFALQADGWWLRSDIIWAKPNPMPESVTDRPTKAHEYLFLMTKAARYFYDADAVREPLDRPEELHRKTPAVFGGAKKYAGYGTRKHSGREYKGEMTGRNKRDVWTIATSPFPSAHFATFPPKLVEPCIKAGTSEKGCCPECGSPWARVVKARPNPSKYANTGQDLTGGAPNMGGNRQTSAGLHRNPGGVYREATTTGWRPSCECTEPGDYHKGMAEIGVVALCSPDPIPCAVLDPFFGAGTVGLVAQRLHRDCIGIELSEDYCRMAAKRIRDDAPLFAEVEIVKTQEVGAT